MSALAPTARVPISCEHSMLFAGLQVAALTATPSGRQRKHVFLAARDE